MKIFSRDKQIYFLCPDIQWDKPTTGGLYYNFIVIQALRQYFGSKAVTSLNLMESCSPRSCSWTGHRFLSNLKYLFYFIKKRPGPADIILVDSRSNALLLLPLFYLRHATRSTVIIIVHHVNYHMSRRRGIIGAIEKKCEKHYISCASLLVTISHSTLRGIIKLNRNITAGNIPTTIIQPGIKTRQPHALEEGGFTEEKAEVSLLYVGSCSDPRKGLTFLIKALHGLPTKQFHLNLAGNFDPETEYCRELTELIERYNLQQKINITGRVSSSKLIRLYQKADVFVFPSLWEGYGIVLAEAMSHGLPIIATNISAIPEIVTDGVNGILVPPKNTTQLLQAMNTLINDKQLRNKMSIESLKSAGNLNTWEDVGQQWIDLINTSVYST